MEFGIGLHIGELLFGNIGIAERLEFSVIGPAANEVARLDDLGKKLDCRIIASQAFVDELRLPWLSLGEHQLRGVDQAHEVFKPDWLA
jgi:adenylate cyclase